MDSYDTSPQESEVVLTIAETGQRIVFPSFESDSSGASYVRVLKPDGTESYWIADEWNEEPELVMGAILGALCEGGE